jgi:hypothetical protein
LKKKRKPVRVCGSVKRVGVAKRKMEVVEI